MLSKLRARCSARPTAAIAQPPETDGLAMYTAGPTYSRAGWAVCALPMQYHEAVVVLVAGGVQDLDSTVRRGLALHAWTLDGGQP